MTARGLFIALEGIDGAGTTTQSERLEAWLRSLGQTCVRTREPSDGPIGNMIRWALRGRLVAALPAGRAEPIDPASVALLFAADRLDHLHSEVAPALAAGHHVVTDRYVMSSLAYQSLDVDLAFVRAINDRAIAPDVTILLEVPADVAMARIDATRAAKDSYEKLDTLRRVAATYRTLAAQHPNVLVLDGTKTRDEVTALIQQAVQAALRGPG